MLARRLLLGLGLLAGFAGSADATTIYLVGSGSAAITPPSTATWTVQVWGAGAAGDDGTGNAGSGGGWAKKNSFSATAGANVQFVLGAPGVTSAQAGGDTWFSTSATLIAPGGGSATTAIGDSTAAGGAGASYTGQGIPGAGGAGGPGGIGKAGGTAPGGPSLAAGGGGGGNGGGTVGGSSTTATGAAGGNGISGTGGAGGISVGAANGSPGGAGAGGGGGYGDTAGAGGAGGNGGDDWDNGGGGAGGPGYGGGGIASNGGNGGTPGGGGTDRFNTGVIGFGGHSVIKITYAGTDPDQIYLMGGVTTAQIPSTWNSTAKAEAWGGGAGGISGVAGSGGAGGGAGAYSRVNALSITPGGTLPVVAGLGGAAGASGGDSSISSSLLAKGGNAGSGVTHGVGGSMASGIGDGKSSGGDGGNSAAAAADVGGGGGGAGGTSGAGSNGAAGTTTQTTGAGGNNGSGVAGGATPGAVNTAGNPGITNSTLGGGGGSGSGGSSTAKTGGVGGFPGGAGGGGGGGGANPGGIGRPGLVLLTKFTAGGGSTAANGFLLVGVGSGSTGTSQYTGPGDIASGATGYWGLRSYTAAYAAGNGKAVNIRRISDSTATDITVLANGSLDVATAATFCAATTCFVTKAYDQTGNGHDMAQATAAQQPQLLFNCLATQPCMYFSPIDPFASDFSSEFGPTGSGPSWLETTLSAPLAQPFTVSSEAERVSTTTENDILGGFGAGNGVTLGFNASANTVFQYAGSALVTATATDAAPHALQFVVNGASSSLSVDGTITGSLAPGANALQVRVSIGADAFDGSNYLQGYVGEVGLWPSALSTGVQGTLSTNQAAFW